jgi:hypothetical protein
MQPAKKRRKNRNGAPAAPNQRQRKTQRPRKSPIKIMYLIGSAALLLGWNLP